MVTLTRPKIDDDVYEEDGVWETVEGNPARAEVVVEEGNGDRKDDEVGNQQEQHAQVPVEPVGTCMSEYLAVEAYTSPSRTCGNM